MPHPSLPQLAPDAYRAVTAVEAAVARSTLEKPLIELVKMRASQINGCAFCLDMHSRAARKAGETEQRLYLLNAWREAPIYSARERAALALTEHLTILAPQAPPAERPSGEFSPAEIANLTVLIGLINLWNRVAIGGLFHLAANAA